MSKKIKVIIFGVLMLLTFLFFRKPALKIETVKITRGDIIESISASGEVDASEKADLTFQGSGKLAWVGVKEGDVVKKYQAIAKLDTFLLNASYQQAINTTLPLMPRPKKQKMMLKVILLMRL